MTDFKFANGTTVYFDDDLGMPTDGQVIDRWTDDDGDNWYAVVDCGSPRGDEYDRLETSLRVTP